MESIPNGCIYKITNKLDLTVYVGQHNKPIPDKRWKKHLQAATNGVQFYLYNAIRLYGSENFEIETLCVCVCDRDTLNRLEAYYAEQYGAYYWDCNQEWDFSPERGFKTGGYNMVWCGEGSRVGITHTPEVRELLRRINTGKIQSEETKLKMSISQTGKKRSKEARDNIRKGKLENPLSEAMIAKLKLISKGKKFTAEQREKMKEGHVNAKKKISEGSYESGPKKEFPCTQCEKILASKKSLNLHLQMHSGEKPFECKICKKTFTVGSNLDQHMLTHTDERPYGCNACHKSFKDERALKKHTRKMHSEDSLIIDL